MHLTTFQLSLSALILTSFAQASSPYSPRKTRNDVLDCLTSHNVTFSVDGSPDWTALQTPFNLRLSYNPAVITIPETPQQISDSVTCAAAAYLKVQAKGGGHSYASYSSGGQNGSLIIEMEKFDEITVDQTSFVAKVGAGQRLGNIAQALYDQGQRALPHGTCSGVGIGGHASHGGYGYDSRKWGLTLDHIIGLDVVLANGSYIFANETQYPDIYFALRGAADSFGIIVNYYFATEAAPDAVLFFTANLGSALSDIDVVTSAFEQFQNFSLSSPYLIPEITYGFYVDYTGAFIIRGWCMDCSLSDFTNTTFPAMLLGWPATDISVVSQTWIGALENLAAPDPLSLPLGSAYDEHDTFYAKSLVTKQAEPLSPAAIKSYWQYIIDQQGQGPWFSIINLYGGPGSAINAVPADASAYSDRSSLWVFQNYGYTENHLPPFPDSITTLIDGMNDAITKVQIDGDFGGYINYVDPDLTATEAAQQYYGVETYDKLLGIKVVVDPQVVFWNPQAIGNAIGI